MGGFATVPAQIFLQILAHQGGWDEALFVLAPLVIIGLLLLLANRRADAARPKAEAREGSEPPTSETTD